MPLNTTIALTTLAEAKTHLGIPTLTTTFDDLIIGQINRASARIETLTGRKLKKRTGLIELMHGRRSNVIVPREYPIHAITEIRVDAAALFADASTIVAATEYQRADEDTTIIRIASAWPAGANNIRLTYDAGYDATANVVELLDLEQACLWLVEWYHRHRQREDMGRTTKGKGDESVGILAAMPPMIREILDEHTRCEVPSPATPIGNL